MIDWKKQKAAVFRAGKGAIVAVSDIDFVDMGSLLGIEAQKRQILENTQNFLDGKGANHALLWGERGCGKSSLVKAVFTKFCEHGLRIIELGAEDLRFLADIIDEVRESEFKFI
ncbi:MAG: DUF815 domain-containing protein, partial [Campylobacter curvus]